MTGWKKALTSVALLLVIAASVAWLIVWASQLDRIPEPDWRLNQLRERMDVNTFKIYTKRRADWRKVEKRGAWKNPDTGDYTLRRVKRCISCGQKVPAMRTTSGKKRPEEVLAELRAAMAYKCPKCGGPVYPSAALPQPPKSQR